MRRALYPLFASLLLACGGSSDENNAPVDQDASTDDSPLNDSSSEPEPGVDTGPIKPAYDVNEAKRKSCTFAKGSKTTATIGAEVPHGDALPFKHVIVLTMENRSFDHYFSGLPKYGVTDVDVAKDTDTNPDPSSGKTIKRFHDTRYCHKDLAHNWEPVHLQYDEGANDGFVVTSNPGGARAMAYYDERDIPYYYWLAKTFGTHDRYFCSLLGPTWPNRFYFWGATSWGRTHTPDTPPGSVTTIVDQMEAAGKTWKYYRNGSGVMGSFAVTFCRDALSGCYSKYYGTDYAPNFANDVKANKLADLVILDPNFAGGATGAQDDDHPPANIQKGQKFIKNVIETLASNPTVWKETVLFITYDEHGGYYDHVPPPEACEPDDLRPASFKFDRLGFRVPFFAISPWTKPGYISHTVADHASITRFIENRWDLPAMTRRDANAWPLLDIFDFSKMSFETLPTGAPSAEPSAAGLQGCRDEPAAVGEP